MRNRKKYKFCWMYITPVSCETLEPLGLLDEGWESDIMMLARIMNVSGAYRYAR